MTGPTATGSIPPDDPLTAASLSTARRDQPIPFPSTDENGTIVIIHSDKSGRKVSHVTDRSRISAAARAHYYSGSTWGGAIALITTRFWWGAERRRCEAVIRQLAVPPNSDTEALRSRVEALRGRPIRLVGAAERNLPCGIWVETDRADLVFYAQGTGPAHQRHIIAHELAHIALGHTGAEVTEHAAELLFRSVKPAAVLRMLNRAGYDTGQEREAELLATLLLLGRPRSSGPAEDQRVQRLATGMGDGPAQP